MNGTCNGTIFRSRLLGPWGGAKRSNIIKSQSQSQFQRFFNQTLCVFSQMKYIKHNRRDLHSVVPWVITLWSVGVQNIYFLNMVVWHIKLKGMSSRHEYTENFFPRIKLVTLGWGQRIKCH